ncbi:uncharacterized protein [Takifugu rubripes]|uniref:uncharacterized protein n=1 Tax=Takifugu rubripes TaxID=31033 RepID=UPI001145B014|nr:uncharacterized protein LOC115247863 [Takifugu rubripes]
MGSNKSKQTNEMTPVKVIIATHPANKRRIQQCMRNWHKMTSGRNQWPLEGSFDPGRCDEVEEELRNKDKKHEVTHMRKKLGNAEQRDILQYFRMEATRNPMMHKDTDYRPPPYYPGRAGQFIMIDEDKVGGKITGKIKVIIDEDEEEAREQPSSSRKDACTSTSQSHLSEGTPRKATHKSENGGIRESKKIKERARKEEEQLKELIRHSAELESMTSQQKTTEDQEGKDKPESSSDEGNDDLEEDDGDTDLSSEDSSVVLWQSPVQNRSKFSAATLTKAKSGQTFDLQLQMEKRETGGGMTLRQRMEKKDQSRGTASAKGAQNDYRYVPWSFMDMITLASKLTPLAEGADKWIEKLEEITRGINLAGGDIKALLIKTAGQTATAEIFRAAGYRGMTVTHQHDEVPFDQMRTEVWKALREKYPSRMDPTKLEKESLKEEDSPSQFLHSYQKMWKTETGSEWDSTETTRALFMMYIKNAMPKEVQVKLNGVVGLMKMTWTVFSEHIIHYVNAYRAEKQALEDQNKILANKLTQLQIGELAKQKKEREKHRPQAAVRAADPEPEKEPTVERVTQAPIVTPVMSPPPASQATPRVQGKRYMLVVVCRFSRWIEACPTSKADHKAAAKFLCKEVFPRFGMPDTISSDNGPHFVSQVIQEMFKILGIKQKYGCVYHPQSQASVERANGVLKTKIAKIMADCNGKLTWVDALPIALMAMRSQTNRLTHLTPHEMLTGRPMPLPQTRGPVEGPAIAQLERELGDYLRALTPQTCVSTSERSPRQGRDAHPR